MQTRSLSRIPRGSSRSCTVDPALARRGSSCARLSLCALPILLIACSSAPPPAPASGLSNQDPTPGDSSPPTSDEGASAASGSLQTGPFGGEHWGFIEASSDNGRVVFVRHFPGQEPPTFGHHGESMGAQPVLTAFDRFSGESREVTELIDVDAERRHFLVIDDGGLWLVDARDGAWSRFDDVDMSSDGNACLLPRQANFSPNGKRVGWISSDASRLNVRDLENGDSWHVAANGSLWRGWPDDEGRGAILAEIKSGQTGWPTQNTSCACRWCNRFAASYGFYGWGGPKFSLEHVDEAGTRSPGEPPEGGARYHGPTASGCEIESARTEASGLEYGPWRWVCKTAE